MAASTTKPAEQAVVKTGSDTVGAQAVVTSQEEQIARSEEIQRVGLKKWQEDHDDTRTKRSGP